MTLTFGMGATDDYISRCIANPGLGESRYLCCIGDDITAVTGEDATRSE